MCIFDAKIRRNIENTVGVLLMASSGSQPKVLLTPVSKKPLLEYALNGDGCKVEGTCQLVHSLKIAQVMKNSFYFLLIFHVSFCDIS